ncbi:unnamed protein product [Rotaria socialis]|uniref:G-protein coupled receptors family 1 profile domain-containing protein n=1 Tax=Rotaria socialis TaxID=392032 RepID=A0A821ULZ3_9BILA|nr:unnamed protein product [Rotaria socialis]CAF4892257.1 unnamed protein product [Rotaria socialis]
MISNETSLLLWPCLHSIHTISWDLLCILCRFASIIILLISIVCFTLNIRLLFSNRCQNSLVISLVLASFMVLIISTPGVIIQLFTCHRHCSNLYCRIEGFICYLSGCLCMLLFIMLSIHRYLSLCAHDRLLSYQSSTFICWLLSMAFTFPLVFDYLNFYVPQGLNFHCGINWQDQTNSSRFYMLLSFILIYFLSFSILFYVNIRAHCIVRNFYPRHCLSPSFSERSLEIDSIRISPQTGDFEQSCVNRYCIRKASVRKRFRKDYHFLKSLHSNKISNISYIHQRCRLKLLYLCDYNESKH